MKKIILTFILSSFLPAIAVAEDKKMQNANPNASEMTGKHMQNANPNDSVMTGKHMMMNDNPYSSHPKGDAGVAKNKDSTKKGYTVIPYNK